MRPAATGVPTVLRNRTGFAFIEIILVIGLFAIILMSISSLGGSLGNMQRRESRRDVIGRENILAEKQLSLELFNATWIIEPADTNPSAILVGCRGKDELVNQGGYFYYCKEGSQLRYFKAEGACGVGFPILINCQSAGYRVLSNHLKFLEFSGNGSGNGVIIKYTIETSPKFGNPDRVTLNKEFKMGSMGSVVPQPALVCVSDESCSAAEPPCEKTEYGYDNCGTPCEKVGAACAPP